MNQKLSDFLLLDGNERIVDDRQELQQTFTHVHTHTWLYHREENYDTHRHDYITARKTTTHTDTTISPRGKLRHTQTRLYHQLLVKL